MVGLQNKERKGMLFIIIYLFIYYHYYYYYNPALGRLHVMERRVLLGTRPNFSIHFLLILGPVSQNPHYNTTEISKVVSVGVEGKKFSKRRWHEVLLVLLFWLGALEFKILTFLFFRCLNNFLGNFPRFSVHKSLKTKANSQRAKTPVFLVYFFTKSEGKQPVC